MSVRTVGFHAAQSISQSHPHMNLSYTLRVPFARTLPSMIPFHPPFIPPSTLLPRSGLCFHVAQTAKHPDDIAIVGVLHFYLPRLSAAQRTSFMSRRSNSPSIPTESAKRMLFSYIRR